MGRPTLPPGGRGKARTFQRKGQWVAQCRVRDYDGEIRFVERTGPTRAAAKRNLDLAVVERDAPTVGANVTPTTRFAELAAVWLADFEQAVEDGLRAPKTLYTYASAWQGAVSPAIGALRLREITPAHLDRMLKAVARKHSPEWARTCRSMASGVLQLAVSHNALVYNPAKHVTRIEDRNRKPPIALPVDELLALLDWLDTDEGALDADLPALTRFLMGTGYRLGEALAVHWQHVNLATGDVTFAGNVVRKKGVGLIVRPGKTGTADRNIRLPQFALTMLQVRYEPGVDGLPIFGTPTGRLRDVDAVTKAFRRALDGAEQVGATTRSGLTSHVFRKTVATLLKGEGIDTRVIADALGHSQVAVTERTYFGKSAANPIIATALDAAMSRGRNRH